MKWYQFILVLIVLVVLREVSGHVIMRLAGIAVLANYGSLTAAAFLSGWLASSIGSKPPTDGQIGALAVLGVIGNMLVDFFQGFTAIVLGAFLILAVHTPIAYVCLILGAKLAEEGHAATPPKSTAPDGTGDE